jgi:hypothetical protein
VTYYPGIIQSNPVVFGTHLKLHHRIFASLNFINLCSGLREMASTESDFSVLHQTVRFQIGAMVLFL